MLHVTNFNHVSYQVTNYAKTRDFYAGLFGMKASGDDGRQCRLSFGINVLIVRNRQPAPKVDHIACTIANWDQQKEEVEAELKRRSLKIVQGDIQTSVYIPDPDGFEVHWRSLPATCTIVEGTARRNTPVWRVATGCPFRFLH